MRVTQVRMTVSTERLNISDFSFFFYPPLLCYLEQTLEKTNEERKMEIEGFEHRENEASDGENGVERENK